MPLGTQNSEAKTLIGGENDLEVDGNDFLSKVRLRKYDFFIFKPCGQTTMLLAPSGVLFFLFFCAGILRS